MSNFRVFSGNELDYVLQKEILLINDEINRKPDDYILNINEIEFLNYLIEKHKIETININFDAVTVSTFEKLISAEDFPHSFIAIREGERYPRDIIKYHIPFEGNQELLHCKTNPFSTWSPHVSIEECCICFEIINFSNDPQRIKKEAESNIASIRQLSEFANNQVNSFNSNLPNYAKSYFLSRKQHLLQKNNFVASLGVPIKKRNEVSNTFTIPKPNIRTKIALNLPTSNEKSFKPEPTLDNETYQAILQIIQDVGKQFERMPSTYINKSEEELRDHLLLVLEPNFAGSATGETFNKTGKTDILLRYEGNNVFIAECKYWKGEKVYLDAISQLLGYLTWRDSKASVILFVKNVDLSSVINTVEKVTSTHQNYLGFVGKKEDTWLSFRFHINGDSNREVKLAVQLFHFPIER